MKFAIKRLTGSDLTFFEAQFRRTPQVRQKAINLNRNVFIDQMFPALAVDGQSLEMEILLTLGIFGPDGKDVQSLTRKITKGTASYKNWRLNGEFVFAPEGDPSRYDALRVDDIALLSFKGFDVPTHLDLFLASAVAPQDAELYLALSRTLGAASMQVLSAEAFKSLNDLLPEGHSLATAFQNTIVDPQEAYASEEVANSLGVPGRRFTKKDAQKMAFRSSEIGDLGEGIIFEHLSVQNGREAVTWQSKEVNALAPYDVVVKDANGGTSFYVEVKTTTEPFTRPFFISMAEVQFAAASAVPYYLYRAYDVEGDNPMIRYADFRPLAQAILESCETVKGVAATGFKVVPEMSELTWSDAQEPEQFFIMPE